MEGEERETQIETTDTKQLQMSERKRQTYQNYFCGRNLRLMRQTLNPKNRRCGHHLHHNHSLELQTVTIANTGYREGILHQHWRACAHTLTHANTHTHSRTQTHTHTHAYTRMHQHIAHLHCLTFLQQLPLQLNRWQHRQKLARALTFTQQASDAVRHYSSYWSEHRCRLPCVCCW